MNLCQANRFYLILSQIVPTTGRIRRVKPFCLQTEVVDGEGRGQVCWGGEHKRVVTGYLQTFYSINYDFMNQKNSFSKNEWI